MTPRHEEPDLSVLEAVFDHVDRHRAAYLESLLTYLAIPSISATGEGVERTANHIVHVLQNAGFAVELLKTHGWPIVLGTLCEDRAKPTLLIYGHYDVQPPDPVDAWRSPPFSPTVRDGRVYARGAGDNKGQHLANILGMASSRAVLGRLPCNVKVLLEGEEEMGSPHLHRFVSTHHRELDADLVIISDGPMRASGEPCVKFGVRGVLCFELIAEGAGEDLHSGHWGGIVPSPLWELVQLLATMRNRDGVVTVPGFGEHVRGPSACQLQALEALTVDLDALQHQLAARRLETRDHLDLSRRLMFKPNLCVNGLHGGYAGPGVKTVLPHRGFAKCDVRLVPDQTCDDIFAKLEAHVRAVSQDVTIVRAPGSMEPSVTPLDTPFAEPVRHAVAAAQGAEPVVVPSSGGSLPSYVFTDILRCPTLGVPYANADEANHAPNENLDLERFFAGIKTGAAIALYVGSSIRER